MIGNQYQVHFSEEDLFHIEGDYCRMHADITPTPECGHFLVRPYGLYELATVNMGSDGYWDVYLRQIMAGLEDGDILLVSNKERMYRCEKIQDVAGISFSFKKVSWLTLMRMIEDVKTKISDLAAHVEKLIH